MLEDLAWEIFCKTGNIDEYLLYKNVPDIKQEDAAQNVQKNEFQM